VRPEGKDMTQEAIETEEEMNQEEIQEEEGSSEEETSDEMVITIGDEEESEEEQEQKKAPEWVRELRKEHRATVKRNRELEAELQAMKNPQRDELPAKPTIEGCDYDEDKYESEMAAWFEAKRTHDEKQSKLKADEEKSQQAWNDKVAEFDKTKKELPVADYEEAEDAVSSVLNKTQQGVIIKVVKNPAMFIYAIGKNEAKLKELADMTDPVEFIAAVAKLEDKINVKKRSAPPPEGRVIGSAPVSGTVDSQLERLRAEASKTGDYTKVNQYKRQLRNK